MPAKPKESNWSPIIYDKVVNMPTENSLFLEDRDEALKYLKWWNRTRWNNGYSLDIISYEQLLYIETKFSDDKEIQNLVQIIKERLVTLRELKSKWLDLIIDKNIYNDLKIVRNRQTEGLELYRYLDRELREWS